MISLNICFTCIFRYKKNLTRIIPLRRSAVRDFLTFLRQLSRTTQIPRRRTRTVNRPHYSTSHFLVNLLLLMVLFQNFLENSPPCFTRTWQDCSHGLHRTTHHPQCAVANSREILMKMGSASNKCHCCGWYGDRRQATWHSEWLCPSLFASTLREQTILHYYNVRFK